MEREMEDGKENDFDGKLFDVFGWYVKENDFDAKIFDWLIVKIVVITKVTYM